MIVVSGNILKTLPGPIGKHVLLLFYDLSCKIAATAGKKATTNKEHVVKVPYKELLNPSK